MLRLPRRIKPTQIIDFWGYLHNLVSAGVSLPESLQIIIDLTVNTPFKKILMEVQALVEGGAAFSQALSHYPKVFSHAEVQLCRVAEQTGDFPRALSSIVDHLRWGQSMRELIVQSLRYPAILLVIMAAFLFIVGFYLLPGLENHLSHFSKKKLPFITNATIFIIGNLSYLGGGLMVGFVILVFVQRYRRGIGKRPWRYSIPAVGHILYRLQILKFFHTLSILLQSKLDILASLFNASQSVDCLWLRGRLMGLEKNLIEGESLSMTLRPLVPANLTTTGALVVGERAGTLGPLLQQSSFHELQQIRHQLRGLLDLVQPLIIILMGVVLGWIILSVLLPLYGQIGGDHG